ncbi:MAG: 30S ribosome-binding factor RbfA [Verrucomicrobia bacterium]|nr:30S ribosome-binding factor RbfA [Verrucomicrobiota bacterium]
MKNRLVRVKELMKRELGDLIVRELTFSQLVTVQDVDITPDLKHAHVFVSVLGGDENDAKAVLSKLHDHRKDLQYKLSRRVILKFTPQLHFKLDVAQERGSRVIDILSHLDIPEDEPLGESPKENPDDPR